MNQDNEISEVSPDELQPKESPSVLETIKRNGMFEFILEPAVFLVFFGLNLSSTVYQNQILYLTCTNVFEYNQSDCKTLGVGQNTDISKDIEITIQPYVAKILMARSLLESIIPAIGSLFIGPWSDKFGRKPVILASFLGYFLGYAIISVITFLSSQYVFNPWIYIVSSIPASFLGGSCGLISGIYCYIADVSQSSRRAYRMVMIEAALFLGLMCGDLLSSYLWNATSSLIVFIVSGLMILISICYVYFYVDESVNVSDSDKKSKFRGLFNFSLITSMFRTCFEKRPNYDRAIIWLVMLILTIQIFALEGVGTISYLFVMAKFDWTLKEYTNYCALGIAILIFGNVIGMYFLQKIFKLSPTSLALLAVGSAVLDTIVKATAVYSWQMYLATLLGLLRGIAGPMERAILSYIVPQSDLGKIMSFTTSLESISPLGAAPLYTFVYSATIQTNPGAFYFITFGLHLLVYIFLAIIYGIQKSNPITAYESIGS